MGEKFVHLHVHSEYSLLDGAGKINDLVKKAKELGMTALALTDHGVMYGVMDFYKAALAEGIKPIIGCEVYQAPRQRFDREPKKDDAAYHLVLLAQNIRGYQNLIQLVSRASLEGFYYKPRVDWQLLEEYHEGLIALSGCLAGYIPRFLTIGDKEAAREAALRYKGIFGKDNFFIEIQDHGLPEQRRLNPLLIDLAAETGIPLAATNDIHYVEKGQSDIHEVLLCIQTGKTLEDEDRMSFSGQEFYLKSPEEMHRIFSGYPQALANTVEIAGRCNVSLELGKNILPEYPVPEGHDAASYLSELCFQGAADRYGELNEAIRGRLEHELNVISKMGFPGYFLIVWDLINFARKERIPVGPGRGSAAGSLVAYCLGITSIDPLKYDLLFERFLNPERVNMPDIDSDFCFERRGEIIRYLQERYGRDHVAQIITFGTMAAKAAVRDVGRVMNIPLAKVDRIAKAVPGELGITLDKALQESQELQQMYKEDADTRRVLDAARQLEGTPRHASTHAAGIVISREPLTNYLPIQGSGEDTVTTQFPMQVVEEIGLLKMDVLGLRTLTVMGQAQEMIKQCRGEEIVLDNISLADKEVYDLLSAGDSSGVFQLESPGMRSILKSLKPERFEDIIALVALYRPGPLGSGMVEDFIQRKHGQIPIKYPHASLETILQDTYGVILYQEQVMRIASEMAGFSLGQADLLRRAMGKKKPEILAAQRKNFIDGASKKGVAEKTAVEIFDLIDHFAGYGFNKSHSAAYALVAYQTAYLKAHYPVEFMAALLTSVLDNSGKVAGYIETAKRMGIKVLPPDINESLVSFTVVGGSIRFGLAAVKNVGRAAVEAIISAKNAGGPFKSLQDFCDRVSLRQVNRRVIESLIKCGAFDFLNIPRRRMLMQLDDCVESAARLQQDRESGQLSLFDMGVEGAPVDRPTVFAGVGEFSQRELLNLEREMLGLYVSDHPITPYREKISRLNLLPLAEIEQQPDGTMVQVAGVKVSLRETMTKRGRQMAYLNLEDQSGAVEILIFPKVYEHHALLLREKEILMVGGRVNRDDEIRLFAEMVCELPEKELWLDVDNSSERELQELRSLLSKHAGDTPVYLKLKNKVLLVNNRLWVKAGNGLMQRLETMLGKNKATLKEMAD